MLHEVEGAGATFIEGGGVNRANKFFGNGPRNGRFESRTNIQKAIGGVLSAAYSSYMKVLTLPIVVEADSDGYFVSCPALQGCYSQGDTYEEAITNIKDAIRLHIEDRIAGGEEFPDQVKVSLSTVEVSV